MPRPGIAAPMDFSDEKLRGRPFSGGDGDRDHDGGDGDRNHDGGDGSGG